MIVNGTIPNLDLVTWRKLGRVMLSTNRFLGYGAIKPLLAIIVGTSAADLTELSSDDREVFNALLRVLETELGFRGELLDFILVAAPCGSSK